MLVFRRGGAHASPDNQTQRFSARLKARAFGRGFRRFVRYGPDINRLSHGTIPGGELGRELGLEYPTAGARGIEWARRADCGGGPKLPNPRNGVAAHPVETVPRRLCRQAALRWLG